MRWIRVRPLEIELAPIYEICTILYFLYGTHSKKYFLGIPKIFFRVLMPWNLISWDFMNGWPSLSDSKEIIFRVCDHVRPFLWVLPLRKIQNREYPVNSSQFNYSVGANWRKIDFYRVIDLPVDSTILKRSVVWNRLRLLQGIWQKNRFQTTRLRNQRDFGGFRRING